MLLVLSTAAIIVLVLLAVLYVPHLSVGATALRHRLRAQTEPRLQYDPGRERRAELRARQLLRSCVGEDEWEMYREFGFLRVWGTNGTDRAADREHLSDGVPYAYLIYPHRPIVAYLPQTGVLLNEYCVTFPDHTRPYGSFRLPDADDVLAKWMALTADERGLICTANMHLPGRQIDPDTVRRDIARLAHWERDRLTRDESCSDTLRSW